MTDLSSKNQRFVANWFLPLLYRCVLVCPAVCGLGTAAFANAWVEFETRCLAALENSETPEVEGLVQLQADAAMDEKRLVGSAGHIYAFGDGRIMVFDPGPNWDAERYCGIRLNDPRDANLSEFEDWIDKQIAQDRYQQVNGILPRRVFETVEWIEPQRQVIVSMALQNGPVTYGIVETDIEA